MNTHAKPWKIQARKDRRMAGPGAAIAAGLALAFVLASSAEAASHFPLEAGNRWIYASRDDRSGWHYEEVRATAGPSFGGYKLMRVENYLFRFLPATVFLFDTARGETAEFSADGRIGILYPWPSLPGEVAVNLPAFVPDCWHGSRGTMVPGGSLEVPAGTFADVAMITYHDGSCADAGVVSEAMARGVGLIRREVMTIRGVETWSLIYAKVNGQEYGEPGIGGPEPVSERGAAPPGRGAREPLPAAATTWGAIKAVFTP